MVESRGRPDEETESGLLNSLCWYSYFLLAVRMVVVTSAGCSHVNDREWLRM